MSDAVALIAGPLHLAALVLAVSGAHKLLEPEAASKALTTAGVPSALASGRAVGAIEVAAGAGLLAFGGLAATLAVGAMYAAFAGFLLVLRRRDDAAPCGCFGASDAPPGATHLVINLACVAIVAIAVVTAMPSLTDVAAESGAASLVGYAALLLAGTLGVFAGTTVVEDIRHTTDLMKA
jgi:hypothetical protein